MSRSRAALVLAGLTLAGCAVGPNYKRPPLTVPTSFYGQEAATAEAHAFADVPWWDVFQDPVLKGLVEESLAKGFDARLAAARVQEARALYGVQRGNLLPDVGYTAGFEHVRNDQFINADGAVDDKWTAKLGFNWEIDLWGKLRRQTEAAKAQYLATEEARRGVMLSLASDLATAYFELRELDAELAIARRTTATFQDTFDLFQRQLEGGTASGLETSRAEASLGSVSAQIPEIERAIVAKESEINFLLGRGPQAVVRDVTAPVLPPDIPPGLPSELLERRPDVREAEDQLRAASAGIGVAKASYFPTLSLTGLFGNVTPDLGGIFSDGKTYSIEPTLLGPIFAAGRIKKNYEAAKARYEQAKVQYEAAVTNSFREVSVALVDRSKLVETVAARERTVAAYREATRLANLRYDSGLSAYFEVLDSQTQLFPAEINLALTRRNQLIAVVNLYKALGGGWAMGPAPSPSPIP